MRYRISPAGAETPVQSSIDLVTSTVWLTIFVGLALVLMGVHGRQHWLQFWGGLTCLCCAAYFLREVFGWLRV